MNDPAITVLMTMFNASRHLRAAIDSILRQTFADFEFLIIDDGSTDDSVKIVENYGGDRIRLIRNATNRGQTPCLNQGLELARGEWIARQDADDLSHPRRLERQITKLRVDRNLALVGAQAWIVDDRGRFSGMLTVPTEADSIGWAMLFENPVIHTAAVFRRDVVQRLGGYDAAFRICQDYDLWLRITSEHRAANLPDRLVTYRHSPASLQHASRDVVRAESENVVRRAWAVAFAERHPSQAEIERLLNFRTGIAPKDVAAFRDFYAFTLAEYLREHRRLSLRDLRRTVALHQAKIGRDVASLDRAKAAACLTRTFAEHPAVLTRLAFERLAGPFLVQR